MDTTGGSRAGTRTHVLVLAKAPVAGRSKTRLSPGFSPAQAAAIAEAALADTLDAVASCHTDRRIVALDGPPGPWLPAGFDIVPQSPGSLNDRLAAAWAYAGGPGLQIGMDTPQVTPQLLDSCLMTIYDDDAALGMAEDGGWWAVALRRPHPEAFRGVPMSQPHTGLRQLAQLRSLGLTVAALPTLRDLDHPDDARAIAERVPRSRTAAAVRATEQEMTA